MKHSWKRENRFGSTNIALREVCVVTFFGLCSESSQSFHQAGLY
jgi:hypothetical protein